MSISALYILDLVGKPLIFQNYRGLHEPEIIDKFVVSLLEREEDTNLCPVFQIEKNSFAFIKLNDLYFVAIPNGNANISLVFVFLHKVIEVMEDYFKEVLEESVRDNFVVIYELLDEILDFGYPQITESKILMEYITQESKKLQIHRKVPAAVTNAVSWRSEGIRYKNNEVFLDIIESVDMMVNVNGVVVRSEISGSVRLKTQLSGMPELHLGLNDKVLCENSCSVSLKSIDLDDIRFHQCVRLCRFVNDGSITFIPPDGEFELMSYRLNSFAKPPFWVDCVVEVYPNCKVEYSVKVTSHFKSSLRATKVAVLVPVRSDADSPVIRTAVGSASYLPDKGVIKWSIKSFAGCREFFMTAKFGLPSVPAEEPEPVPPIQVHFFIALFNMSGLRVKYLKVVEKSGYQSMPWVRHVTQSGEYQLKIREVLRQ